MTRPPEPLTVALRVAREMDRLGIPYLLAGSLASMLHGEPRATLDVDFAVQMTPDAARRLAGALEDEFYVMPEALVEAARTMGMANVVHKRPYLKVDLHVRPTRGHHQAEMQRAQLVRVGEDPGDELRVATPEDVVLQKLRWFRLGEEVSDRQWRDVLGVLKRRSGALDLRYLRQWARELGVADLLERAFEESGAR